MSLTGPDPEQPTRVGVPIADLLAGMYGAYGVVAAINDRHLTGRGQVVRTSLLAAVVGVHAFQGTRYTVAGEVPRAAGNHHPSICPYGMFRCADGVLQIAVGSEGLWQRFAQAFELRTDDPRLESNQARVRNRTEVIDLIQQRFAERSLDNLLSVLAEIGVPAGEVKTLDRVYEWEQTASQGLIIDVDHPVLGSIRLPGPPLRFGDNAHAGGRDRHLAPPTLGQHNDAVRAWLEQDLLDVE